MVKSRVLTQTTWILILVPLFTRCVTLTSYLTSPCLSFLTGKVEITTVPASRGCCKFINTKHSERFLAHTKCYVSISYDQFLC